MTDFFTRFRTFFSCVLAVIIVAPVLAQSAVANEEGGALSGFGSVNSSELVDSGAQAVGEKITISVLKEGIGGGVEIRAQIPRGAPATVDSAWDPDKDPAYQKALRHRLMSDDDSIFFNANLMDTATNRTTYSLQDPCASEDGDAFDDCRQEQECTADGGGEGVNMDVVVGGAGEDGRASRGTQMCVANAEAAEADDEGVIPLPVFTLQDFQRLNVAPAVSTVEPAPDTLKNMNTNVFAVADAQMFETELGGFPVAVRAYPVQYSWNYGDGAALGPTPLTGAPLAEGDWDIPTDTSHVYSETGDYSVTLTTFFYGEYNVAGTGWQPVAGFNEVASAPVPISVWKATVRNVADDCNENPRSFGCPGTN
ncbi:PKD domain-containing protein [Kocuria carniphila]|uniref:PKD domain-containing protein n=1 Tax=Kocuria carniphila TaxID=262208 RepID=UPI0034D0060E